MTKRKAIKVLKDHFHKVEDVGDIEIWHSELFSHCKTFFGQDKVILEKVQYHTYRGERNSPFPLKNEQILKIKSDNHELLSMLVNVIKTRGVYSNSSNVGFLANWKNWQILLSLIPIVGIIGSAGYGIRSMQVDREKIRLENKYDSVVKASSILIHRNNVPQSKKDTAKTANN